MLGGIPNPEANQECVAHTGETDYQTGVSVGKKRMKDWNPTENLPQAGSHG